MSHCVLISDAAKEVQVESHVLRYWEEELHLPIKRNELGHRYYTEADVERFKQIKNMKERGLQLKAIKLILKNGNICGKEQIAELEEELDQFMMVEDTNKEHHPKGEQKSVMAINIVNKVVDNSLGADETGISKEQQEISVSQELESKEEKSRKLQWILQEMIKRAVQENNAELCRELKEGIIKELDYQFRMQEEREESREKRFTERNEEYYKKMDELLRKKTRRHFVKN